MVKTKYVELEDKNLGVDITGAHAESNSHPGVAESFNNAFEDLGQITCELDLIHWMIAAFAENPGLEIEIDAWTEHGESGRFWTNGLGVFWGWINTDNIWDNFNFWTGKMEEYTIFHIPKTKRTKKAKEGQPNGL